MLTTLATVLAALIVYLIWSFYGDRIRVYTPRALRILSINTTAGRKLIWHNLKSTVKAGGFAVVGVLVILAQFLFHFVLYPILTVFILIKTVVLEPVDSKD